MSEDEGQGSSQKPEGCRTPSKQKLAGPSCPLPLGFTFVHPCRHGSTLRLSSEGCQALYLRVTIIDVAKR